MFFGNASGPVPPVDPLALASRGSLAMVRPRLGDYVGTRAELQERSAELFRWLSEGKLKVAIDREFELAEAAAAHAYLEAGKTTGKVLLRI